MEDFDVCVDTAERALAACDKLLEAKKFETVDETYVRGVKDTLGWLLGYYEQPDCFEEDLEDEGEKDE